jgi:hypothetical protein
LPCKCGSKRQVEVNGKTSDMCFIRIGDKDHDGYVPRDLGIGGGDYLEFTFCLDCGLIKGKWPRPPTELETGE